MTYNVQKYEIKEFSLVYIIICLIYFVELKKIAIFYPCILGKYAPDRPQGCNFFCIVRFLKDNLSSMDPNQYISFET